MTLRELRSPRQTLEVALGLIVVPLLVGGVSQAEVSLSIEAVLEQSASIFG